MIGAQAFATLPALMHDVQTRARRVLVPCLTRIFWMFGFQRLLERLCEKVTRFPKLGSLPQTSQRYDMWRLLENCWGRVPSPIVRPSSLPDGSLNP